MATVKSSNINITDLDFVDVEVSLKEYLQGQDTLKDYNFEHPLFLKRGRMKNYNMEVIKWNLFNMIFMVKRKKVNTNLEKET